MAEPTAKKAEQKNKLSPWQVFTSTCAAAFGVQTDKNRQRDFAEGNIKTYITAGIIFTLLFITAIIFVVRLVLNNAGLE